VPLVGIVHWDDIERHRAAKGEMDATWQQLAKPAGAVGIGVNRMRVAPGKLPTPPHSHGASEPPWRLTSCRSACTPDIDQVGKTASPDLLRGAGQLLDRRLLQGRGDRATPSSLDRGLGSTRAALITVFEGIPGVPADERPWSSGSRPASRERIQALGRRT
jgi:hypothetical protein